jgi:hypothetical protein
MQRMDKNPYESPQHPGSPASPPRRIGLAIVLGILTIPAMGIAFFSTCLATLAVTQSEAALWVGGVSALAAGAGMIYLTVRAARSPK